MIIYNNDNISSFVNGQAEDDETNSLLEQIKFVLNIQNGLLDFEEQIINTENDLKCILFHKIKQIQNLDFPFEIHSEESDRICITNNYCRHYHLTQNNDIENDTTKTRTIDLTVTINPIEGEEIDIQKGYSRFGKHIDIELKYIRAGYKSDYIKAIRRDLCKLKYVLDDEQEHHNNFEASKYGLLMLGFRKLSTLERYKNELIEYFTYFNQFQNTGLLLFYRENQ